MYRSLNYHHVGVAHMNRKQLLLLLFITIIAFTMIHFTKTEEQTPYFELQIEAAEKMITAMHYLKEERIHLGFPIDEEIDPLNTGLIGINWPNFDEQSITTTLGKLEAKITSTNPNFAALMIRYFQDLNIQKGDSVAINFSSSFPALNIAVMSAVEVMELTPLIMTSIGSSSYGANIIGFTYVDMEYLLYEAGIWSHKSQRISIGGDNDQLLENSDLEFKMALLDKYEKLGYETIYMDDLSLNIENRYQTYQSSLIQIKAFINVGGNMVGFGKNRSSFPNGLIKRMSIHVLPETGLIERFLRDDIPVIHLLNVQDLARKNQMDIDASSAFPIAVGLMYTDVHYRSIIIFLSLLVVAIYTLNTYLHQKRIQKKR
jgi:poly-gamma-glutamate system protein